MNDTQSLLVVVVAIVVICWLARLPVWRRCRCGAEYCNDCNRRGK